MNPLSPILPVSPFNTYDLHDPLKGFNLFETDSNYLPFSEAYNFPSIKNPNTIAHDQKINFI